LEPIAEPGPRLGLRLRLWLGCLGGTLLAGAGLWWALGFQQPPGPPVDPRALLIRLAIAYGPALLAGIVLAIWLDRGIVGRVRALSRSLASGQMAQAHGRPIEHGWGELAGLTEGVQTILYRQRQLTRASGELQRLSRQIAAARDTIERWTVTERWVPLTADEGPLRSMVERLNEGFTREADVLEQNQQAAVQVKNDLLAALAEARESAEQAEHGFVDATALLTTVRELQRLSTELQQAVVSTAGGAGPPAQTLEPWRAAAAAAIQELIDAANESVEHLGAGLLRIQEIAEQVQLLANRATLIALNSVIASAAPERPAAPHDSAAGEMKQLAREVRAATERVAALSREIEREVQGAAERMRGIRERVATRLEQAPSAPPTEAARPSEDLLRLLDRVREMIQDAMRKGERLSAAGEHSSRAADALVQKLEDEARDLEGLAVRLSPPGQVRPRDSGARPGNLRMLGDEESPPDDEAEGQSGEERP
jgi:methyl-accepting chemotaxis protein